MSGQLITVGIDGSKSAAAALRFAIDEALLRGATVLAVTGWEADPIYAGYGGALMPEEHAAHQKSATQTQENTIRAVTAELSSLPPIDRRVVRAHPGHALVQLSRDAVMLVVGTEHKGMLKRATAGSISAYCSRHSTVPVLVVPSISQHHDDGSIRERVENAVDASLSGAS
jgi:nucleotide-binding universal stress UspA family protein